MRARHIDACVLRCDLSRRRYFQDGLPLFRKLAAPFAKSSDVLLSALSAAPVFLIKSLRFIGQGVNNGGLVCAIILFWLLPQA